MLLVSLWLRASSPDRGQPAPAAVRASSVAILPFINASPDSADDYLGPGVGAELTGALTRVPDSEVPPAPPLSPTAGAGNPRLAGRRLGVATVLVGSVRRSGDRLRVTARLVDVDEGFDLWSEAYERAAGELFDIEDEIRDAVATALRAAGPARLRAAPVGSAPASPPTMPTWRAAIELDRPTPGSNRRAVDTSPARSDSIPPSLRPTRRWPTPTSEAAASRRCRP